MPDRHDPVSLLLAEAAVLLRDGVVLARSSAFAVLAEAIRGRSVSTADLDCWRVFGLPVEPAGQIARPVLIDPPYSEHRFLGCTCGRRLAVPAPYSLCPGCGRLYADRPGRCPSAAHWAELLVDHPDWPSEPYALPA